MTESTRRPTPWPPWARTRAALALNLALGALAAGFYLTPWTRVAAVLLVVLVCSIGATLLERQRGIANMILTEGRSQAAHRQELRRSIESTLSRSKVEVVGAAIASEPIQRVPEPSSAPIIRRSSVAELVSKVRTPYKSDVIVFASDRIPGDIRELPLDGAWHSSCRTIQDVATQHTTLAALVVDIDAALRDTDIAQAARKLMEEVPSRDTSTVILYSDAPRVPWNAVASVAANLGVVMIREVGPNCFVAGAR